MARLTFSQVYNSQHWPPDAVREARCLVQIEEALAADTDLIAMGLFVGEEYQSLIFGSEATIPDIASVALKEIHEEYPHEAVMAVRFSDDQLKQAREVAVSALDFVMDQTYKPAIREKNL